MNHTFSNLKVIVPELKKDKILIEESWIKRERVKKIFLPYKIHPKLFIKHFGSRVIDYMIGVIEGESEAGNCPIVHVMLDYFSDKDIALGDVYLICSELKNVLLLYYIKKHSDLEENIYFELADLLDSNFEGVLNEYFEKQCNKIVHEFNGLETEIENTQNKKSKIEKDRLADIRFNQSHKITSIDFMSTLDPTIADKVENFVEQLDEYNALLYDLESMDGDESLKQIQLVNNILLDFYYSVDSMGAFPIIVRTFNQLIEFLNTISIIQLENKEKRLMLGKILQGLGIDLENWIKSIFEEQTTDDIHYFDASFANNCIEVEALFCEEELESDEDDLEFF